MCYDPEAYSECEAECRELLRRGRGPDYELCEEECHKRYLDCEDEEENLFR